MTAQSVVETTRPALGSDDLDHVVCTCCDPDLALCGRDMTGTDWVDDNQGLRCVVCADLQDLPCWSGCVCEECA